MINSDKHIFIDVMAKCSKCNTDVLGTFKFCHNCGSTLSRNATTGQTEIMTDSSNKRAEVPMTFENFRKRLSSARLENNKDTSKKRKKDENKEVMINVGIMKVEKGLLKPDKGKGMTLRVPVSIRKMELLRRSIDRHSAYNRLFDKDAEYTLVYPDGTEVLTLPGQPTQLFQLDSYKEDLGKPYNRITFYLVERCILDGDDEEDVDSDVVKTDPCQSTLDSPLERSKPLLSSHDVDNDVVETDPRQSTLDSKLEGSKPLLSNQDYPLTGTVFKPSSSDTQLTTLREMFPSTEEQCLKDALNSTHSLEEAINLMLSSSESPLQYQSAYASLLDINDFSDTEVYDDDVDNFSTAFKSDSTSFSRDISVKDLLLQLKQAEVKTDDFLRLKIRRKNIWEDTKFKFVNNVKHEDLKKSLKVQFIGEPAVDAGGPSREFFTLINSAGISRLMQDGVFMHNISYLENKEYSLFGKLTALGLLHGSPGPRCFSKSVVDYIVYGSYSALEPSIDEVPNVEVREALHRLNSITDAEEFKQEASFNSNYRFEAGYCKPIVTLADKAEFFRCISLHYIVLSSISELNQYIEGLTTCNVLTVVREHPNVLRSLFEVTAEVTADFLGDMFEAVYSPSDSNRFTVEQSIMFNFHQYLEDLMSGKVKSTIVQEHVGDKEVVLSPKHLLQFVTGSEEVPAVGFIPRPTINFTQEKRKLTANTCGNVLTIPVVGMTEYATFADEFTFCIMNSPGFGLI